MLIYISGPMTGYFNNNQEAFFKAAEKLKKLGHKVINPAEEDLTSSASTYKGYLQRDLNMIIDNKPDRIYLLRGWEHSKGAITEVALANALKIEVIHECQEEQLLT